MKKILVAEDEKPLSFALELKLKEAGFKVHVTYDGDETLSILNSESFDLILLDILMPGPNGFEILEYLQKKGNKTPVVITSNLSQKEDVEKAKKLGARDFLVKSTVTLNEIINFVSDIVES